MSVFKRKDGKWRVQIRRKGWEDFDQSFNTQEEAELAQELEMQRRAGLEQGAEHLTFAAAAREYKASMRFGEKAEKTQLEESRHLGHIVAKIGGHTLSAINNNIRIITGWRDARSREKGKRTGRKLSTETVRCEMAAISSVFKWAVEERLLPTNPLVGIKRGDPVRRKRRLHDKEEVALSRLCLDPFADELLREGARFILLQTELGCRPGELAKAQRADIDIEGVREIVLRDTKNGRDRAVYLTKVAVDRVCEQLVHIESMDPDKPPSPFLFGTWSYKKKAWVSFNYRYPIDQLIKARVLEKGYHGHAGRKEFISRGIEEGLDTSTIQQITGQRSPQSVERYKVDLKLTKRKKAIIERHSEAILQDRVDKIVASLTPQERKRLFETVAKNAGGIAAGSEKADQGEGSGAKPETAP